MLNRTSLVSVLAFFSVSFAPPAAAQLNGVYVGDQTSVCINSVAGFDANLALLGPGNINSSASVVQTFLYPDGTGQSTVTSLGVGHAATTAGSTPAVESVTNCPFTYTYDSSTGKVTSTFGTCTGMALTGPSAGQPTQFTGNVSETLLIENGTKLERTRTKPTVEIFKNLVTGFTQQRICHRDGVFFFRGPAQAN
jgi:hypothetical protein